MTQDHGDGSALYLDGRKLAEKVDSSQAYEDLKKYMRTYEKATYLAVDGLEAIMDTPEAQDQVFHLYNALMQSGGKFAASVRTPPTRWRFVEWLSTRLLWGLVLEIQPVGDESRVDVLRKMASDIRLYLPENAARWLITHLPRDPAYQLEALTKIDKLSLTTGRKVSIHLMKQALEYVSAG